MQFRLRTIFLLFVVVWSSMAAFGPWGIAVAAYFIALITCIRVAYLRSSPGAFFIVVILVSFAIWLCTLPSQTNYYSNMLFLRDACKYNIRDLGFALHNFHDSRGHFPLAYSKDAEGRSMHSWRIRTLPYLEQSNISKAYDFREPWDSPKNRKLANPIRALMCPDAIRGLADAELPCTTHYLAITGPGTMWEKKTNKHGYPIGHSKDFTDDPSTTILLVENVTSDVPWMEPRDLTIDEVLADEDGVANAITSYHNSDDGYFLRGRQSGGHVLMADRSVHFLSGRISREDLKALLTTDGGETISLDNLNCYSEKPFLERYVWAHVIGFPLFWLSLILLVMNTKITAKKRAKWGIRVPQKTVN